jgi:hypothetical protein
MPLVNHLLIALDTFERFPGGRLTTDTLENLILFAAHDVVQRRGGEAGDAWRVIDELRQPFERDIDFLGRFYDRIALRDGVFQEQLHAREPK